MDEQLERKPSIEARLQEAVRLTAPGTTLRTALDMMIAGELGALITIGDEEAVLASGNDGFPLDIAFTANRLFELSKMDGAIVVNGQQTQILRANFHLNPDPNLPTNETGMRHRTAARMSQVTDAVVLSVSERRRVVTVYVGGRSFRIRSIPEIMTMVSQLLVTLQTSRQELDRALLRLTSLELENFVTLADVTNVVFLFEVLMSAAEELDATILELGREGRTISMRRDELMGTMDDEYNLFIRDYALDSSPENAERIRAQFHEMSNLKLRSPLRVAEILGHEDVHEDSVIVPLGLRTLSGVSVVREGMAESIVDEFGSLRALFKRIQESPEILYELGVNNPNILADSLRRMRGRSE
ncbi:MAG: DNA integrity scanning diadenylate cyclase DisA [Atopobiaceae bacterium]|nr:DNA integrity scanning diadenylate cyclase DisA [Atopobiaceae bacterium]